MDTFFQFIFRVALFLLGLFFFLILLFLGFLVLVFWGIRQLWYKISGKPVQPMGGFRFNPKEGFNFFYSRTQGHASPQAPRASQREMDDVTDVEIKEIVNTVDREDESTHR